MSNPNPSEETRFKPGESGNPNGRPKGIRSWSTVVKRILSDEKLFEMMTADKNNPAWVDVLETKNAANAIVGAMVTKALAGDKNAAEWLRKTGFGDKLDITSDDMPIQTATVVDLGNVANKHQAEQDSDSD
jgi:hypothetical protein